MSIVRAENYVLTLRSIVVIVSLGLLSTQAVSGPSEDYESGLVFYENNDFAQAMPLMKSAATAGHVKAMIKLGIMLDAAEFDEEAAKYYRMAADTGDPEGYYYLGTMYASGDGVKVDHGQAVGLFRKAAEGGFTQAIWVMADAFLNSKFGISENDKNSKEALKWVSLAGEKNYIPALEALEKAYRNGDAFGLQASIPKADETKARLDELLGKDKKLNQGRGRRGRK